MRRYRFARNRAVALFALAAVVVLARPIAPASARTREVSGIGTSAFTTTATTVADITPASGGLCAVPGIGDIGGLLGLCALGTSGLTGDLNNICQPSLPDPEPAASGIDAMVAPAAAGKQPATLYDQYGVAGQFWAATNLQCSDMTSLIGNNVAGVVFDVAKSIDRVTISVYQSAAGEGILSWLQRVADRLITSLGNAIYFPYLAVVVVIAAIWLGWQGLVRKRGTRAIEGTAWMVAACAAAIFLIAEPAAVTGLGRDLSDGISQALNVAFAKLPSPGPASCVPVQKGDPQVAASYSYTSASTVVDQNADELWALLVCKPWLVGEFGTSEYPTGPGESNAVSRYGRALLWAQAIAVNEEPTAALVQAKQAAYAGIASSIQANDPAIYPLFQGKQWTTRLEVALAALFAAVVAGVLVLLISVTLILLKLSFLLLLIVGPFFLLVGVHPGFGRLIALRWVELLIGVLLKQAAVALVLSLLLYCYALIMGTSDAVLPWALKILLIALVTVAAFIYRKPFQHLFSAVGYGVLGSQDRAEVNLDRAGAMARANTVGATAGAVQQLSAYRADRWVRRNTGQLASVAMTASSGGAGAAVAAGVQAAKTGKAAGALGAGGDEGSGSAGTGVSTAQAATSAAASTGRAHDVWPRSSRGGPSLRQPSMAPPRQAGQPGPVRARWPAPPARQRSGGTTAAKRPGSPPARGQSGPTRT